ncbi:MAG TPA: hypothetical protein VFF35_14290 [Bacteroidia bacterium]|nr:hypothetical protein [Bacteroidia bacterium]
MIFGKQKTTNLYSTGLQAIAWDMKKHKKSIIVQITWIIVNKKAS